LNQPTDEELLRRMAGGEEEAFTAFYRRWQAPIYRFALQMSGDRQLAEEVTQDVFLELIRGVGRFDAARGAVRSWLFGAARHQAARRMRAERRYAAIEDGAEGDTAEPGLAAAGALGDLARDQLRESVRQAVLSLPAHYREAVVLCDLQEVSYEEAARVLECAVGTVRSRLSRARALLAGKLRAYAASGV
jgi:RNA polymerase sigma-70 factor (ECF subfamily)